MRQGKGEGTVIRNLNYLLSRCQTKTDIDYVLEHLHSKNPILLIQLYIHYMNYNEYSGRTFKFTKNNMLMVHKETLFEVKRRKSFVSKEVRNLVVPLIYKNLLDIYKGKLGTVYVDERMKKIALPLQETTSMCGFRVLPKGSRIPLGKGKIIRGFTYWEKVDDIDLSVMGITDEGTQEEFSWRTMAFATSPAIVYSGDQTSGYNGGSEYYDIDIEKFKNTYPNIKYLVFCNNVYSRIPFIRCNCKAGYMIRKDINTGEIFEPKTVESSFVINCDSTFAYLFGIDLEWNEFVWLNIAKSGGTQVAGTTSFDFLFDYFKMTSIINLYDLFFMLASSITTHPTQADVVVTDEDVSTKEDAILIRSCDYEKIVAYMNLH